MYIEDEIGKLLKGSIGIYIYHSYIELEKKSHLAPFLYVRATNKSVLKAFFHTIFVCVCLFFYFFYFFFEVNKVYRT